MRECFRFVQLAEQCFVKGRWGGVDGNGGPVGVVAGFCRVLVQREHHARPVVALVGKVKFVHLNERLVCNSATFIFCPSSQKNIEGLKKSKEMQALKDYIVAFEEEHGRNNHVRRHFNRLLRAGGKRGRDDDGYSGPATAAGPKRVRTPDSWKDRQLQTLQAQYQECMAEKQRLVQMMQDGNYAPTLCAVVDDEPKNIAMKNNAVQLLSQMDQVMRKQACTCPQRFREFWPNCGPCSNSVD